MRISSPAPSMLALVVAFAGGLGLACFRPPSDDVLFACDPVADPTCPDGYGCELDGCCHKDGSDVEANFGLCRLSPEGNGETATDTSESGSESGSESESDSTDTGSEGESGSETETDTGSASDTDTGSATDTDTTSG